MDQSYDVNLIFAEMESDLIASYQRNMARHAKDEIVEGFSWPMWQQKKLADLQAYRKEARVIINKHANTAVHAATGVVVDNYKSGKTASHIVAKEVLPEIDDINFGRADRRKVDALIDAVRNDFQTASSAALRLVDDEYRQIVFKTQVAYSAGATTLGQAIDSAASDFLQAGINCIRYKNGNNVNIASYAEMALRTSAKKAYLTGEGARNNELGISLVQITSYGGCSELCLPWQGKVYVDDVYSGGKDDGVHQKLSFAMGNGLFHPNCRHASQPFFEGISTLPPQLDEERVKEVYQAEQRQREIERNIRKYKRVEVGSTDPQNKGKAAAKVGQWQAAMRQHLKDNTFLSRRSYREQGFGIPHKPTSASTKPATPKAEKRNKPEMPKQHSFVNPKEMAAYATELWKNFSKEDLEKIGYYVGSPNAFHINQFLYSGKYDRVKSGKMSYDVLRPTEKHYYNQIAQVSEVVSKHTIPQDMRLLRNVDLSFLQSVVKELDLSDELAKGLALSKFDMQELKDKLKGVKYTNKGFLSTSYDKKNQLFEDKKVHLELLADKGIKGLVTNNRVESEILFDKGTEIEFVEIIDMGDNNLRVVARIIG